MGIVVTPEFRINFPAVFKPRLNKLSGKEEYGLTALFPKGANLIKLKEACEQAVIKKWGADKTKWPKNLRMPIRDQAEKAKERDGQMVLPPGYEEGAFYCTFKSSKDKPGVVDKNVQPILDESEIYSGCWVRASVNAFAYDQAGNRGVSFGLVNLQKLRDDKPLGARTRPEDDFSAVGDDEGSAADLFS